MTHAEINELREVLEFMYWDCLDYWERDSNYPGSGSIPGPSQIRWMLQDAIVALERAYAPEAPQHDAIRALKGNDGYDAQSGRPLIR